MEKLRKMLNKADIPYIIALVWLTETKASRQVRSGALIMPINKKYSPDDNC